MKNELCTNQEQQFKLPLTGDGFQYFNSFTLLKQAYKQLCKQYQNGKQETWHFYFNKSNAKNALTKQWKQVKLVRCSFCTCTIYYGKKQDGYFLIKMNNFHLHVATIERYLFYLGKKNKLIPFLRDIHTIKGRQIKNKKIINKEEHFFNILANIPFSIKDQTIHWVMNKNFGVNEQQLKEIYKRLKKKYQISFKELIHSLRQKGYHCRFLPEDLLQDMPQKIRKQPLRKEQIKDQINPELPNLLLIVTPEMRELYQKFGQVIGFDLTFSVISERTVRDEEYKVGVFAGVNAYKKIVIFGLVVTNSQSVFAYSYLFQQFFKIMGSSPDVIITDEQLPMHWSLLKLKKEGIFKGHHLFDMFHILRKFRKFSIQRKNYPLFRDLIHSKNRILYRKIFKQLIKSVVSQKQLQLIRNFDLNSEKYCYAQVPPKFVGVGVSNSCNEFFHSLIKHNIPNATSFVKAVQIILQLISRRLIYALVPVIDNGTIQQKFQFLHMKSYKTCLSDKVYLNFLSEVSSTPDIMVFPYQSAIKKEKQLQQQYFQEEQQKTSIEPHFIVKAREDYFIVYKKYKKMQNLNDNTPNQRPYKFECTCELSQKAGFPCCHLAKVLISQKMDFFDNIHKRLLLQHSEIQLIKDQNLLEKIKLKSNVQRQIYQFDAKKKESYIQIQDNGTQEQEEEEVLDQVIENGQNMGYNVLAEEQNSNDKETQNYEEPSVYAKVEEESEKDQNLISCLHDKESIAQFNEVKTNMINDWLKKHRIQSVKRGQSRNLWIFPTFNTEILDVVHPLPTNKIPKRKRPITIQTTNLFN